MKTREEIIEGLIKQYKEQFAGNGYKNEFEIDAYMGECNFGGLCIILGNSGDSVIVWRDWSDDSIDNTLIESMIEYHDDPEDPGDGEDPDYIAQFLYKDIWYNIDNFMRS